MKALFALIILGVSSTCLADGQASPHPSKAKLPKLLTCQADCKTERLGADATELGNCWDKESFEINLKKDGRIEGALYLEGSGWDGDQYYGRSIKVADLEALAAGKVKTIQGTDDVGFDHGATYISEFEINCTLKK